MLSWDTEISAPLLAAHLSMDKKVFSMHQISLITVMDATRLSGSAEEENW